jgi:methionyl-tRNA formyltransferase
MTSYKKIIDNESLWGALYTPLKEKKTSDKALRVVLFGSTNAGALVVDSLLRFEQKYPDMISLVAVATDDPADPDTRISVSKRIWKYYNREEMLMLRNKVIDLSTGGGIPCYTGSIKTQYFRKMLLEWKPDVILMCCFGQIVDPVIFNYPVYGMYNFHPSDLAANIGVGAQPFQDTMMNGSSTSVMTIHHVNEKIDQGPVVGFSPDINIKKADGNYPVSILSLQEKIPSVSGWLSVELISDIIKNKQAGIKKPVSSVDFAKRTPEKIKQKLVEPANDDLNDMYTIPLHDTLL